ncbi:hypothetical protein HYFRA_00007833 [Hymenoscyphus fraxineus]|uniref:non-specific serine/threonine protein kinase n=1 Tax=Hymenoscyphus fraxineus TaxID=746836 RepID=A0A9N9KKY5_9HELO|nr:hypothetical protein HYFRA_00007833 [Hymenoscyphus fraxineus]
MASSTRLQVQGTSSMTETKQRAQEDAQKMQSAVNELCANTGRPQPRYELLELIGKGSFGRVYLGEHKQTKALVAIKVLNIEEADIVNPRGSDAFGDIRKEIMALQTLRDHKAKNINVIMEAENWGSTVWLVTEYCSGGSIQTLMKPTSPNGLAEQWVIPIVREVAEAIMWVHRVGLVHRDIKAANVLITEQGSLQLCDFGVAGIVEGKLDKRTTIIGTPHWMAPELLLAPPGATYGKEVDIWAFGSLIYECATGYPPNVGKPLSSMEALGRSMQKPEDAPRLEDDRYSDNLKDIVAFCLQSDIEKRPKIEAVQKHSYIANTESQYPTATLASLVVAYKAWTDQGGYRKSLFQSGGVQEDVSGLAAPVYGDDWNFSTTATFDAQVSQLAPSLDIDGVYAGNALDLRDETVRPQKAGRRRPPPEALARVPPPLAKVFDPNTMSNYNTSSKVHYNAAPQQYNSLPPDLYEPPSNNQRSDLPLRNNTGRTSTRESMIDLGGHDMETGISSFADTIKPGNRQPSEDDDHSDFHRPALSDPADTNPNRRTQDWKFPSMAPASADPEVSRFPASSYELPRPAVTPAAGGRPALMHHPTEPLPNMDRQSVASLIDLDMGMPDPYPVTRPSTANSDVGSATSEHVNTGNPFEFERHASYVAPNNYEPSIYLEESNPIQFDRDSRIDLDMALDTSGPRDVGELSDFSEAETAVQSGEYDNVEYLHVGPPPNENQRQNYTFDHFPPLGPPPSAAALAGTASRDEMLSEIDRLLGGFRGQLEAFRDVYDSPAVRSRSSASNNSNNRRR